MKKFKNLIIAILIFTASMLNFSCKNSKESKSETFEFVAEDFSVYPDYAKFGIKSAKLTMKSSAMGMKQDMTQYFDDWGQMTAVEINMSMLGNKTNMKVVLKDGVSWEYDVDTRKGIKRNIDTLSYDNINFLQLTAEKLSELNIEFKGTETYLNRTCNKFLLNNVNSGIEALFYVWKGIVLKSEAKIMGVNVQLDVVDLVENFEINPIIFEIPEDVKFEEMDLMF